MLKDYISQGGATLSVSSLSPVVFTHGYQVAVKDKSMVVVLKDTPIESIEFIIHALQAHIKESRDTAYIGLWVNKGKLYIDKSYYIDNSIDAYRLASAHNQKELFNWRTFKGEKV